MSVRVVLQPPEIVRVDRPVLFLGGPIQGAPDWQAEAIEIIHNLHDGIIIASPRKDYAPDEFVYEDQVDWETHYLRQAARNGATMFWLAVQTEAAPGRDYAQTSRFELGEAKKDNEYLRSKLVVGIEEGFGNARYIRRRLGQDCPDVPILDNLFDACRTSVELVVK